MRKRKCGIYRILNRNNGKLYIGSAVNLSMRWREHVWQLDRDRHVNRHLQSAWKKHGAEAFVFEVLEHIDSDTKLVEREQDYLDRFQSYKPGFGYNISPVAGSTLGVPCSPETAAKISAANKGKVRSEAHRAILRRYAGAASATEESRRKISEANIRRGAMTPEISRMGSDARRGVPLTAQRRAHQSAAMKANLAHHEHLRALNDRTRGVSTILSEEQILHLLDDRARGMTYLALGKKYGISNVSAKNWCVRRGVPKQETLTVMAKTPEPLQEDAEQLSLF